MIYIQDLKNTLLNVRALKFEPLYLLKTPKWSTKEAELDSHLEILNQSALISITDLRGNIIHANELFCSVSKYSLAEIINKPHSIIRHPDSPAALFKDMWQTIKSGRVWQGEIKNRAKDGTDYWVIATMSTILGENGKPEKYIGIRYDITKQKRVEEELRQMKKKADKQLIENIIYAKHIHNAILSSNENDATSDDSFLIYKAQNIISGDFYKIERNENNHSIVVGDSTGHGISASYISILALNTLSRILSICCENPAKILSTVNAELNRITRYGNGQKLLETADMIVACLDKNSMKLTYASAKMRSFIIRKGELIVLEKDKCTIGETRASDFEITNRTVDVFNDDAYYIMSDGIIDQFGGEKDKRLGFKKIIAILLDIQHYSMLMQKKIIEDKLSQWQGNNEQTDDITFLGIKI